MAGLAYGSGSLRIERPTGIVRPLHAGQNVGKYRPNLGHHTPQFTNNTITYRPVVQLTSTEERMPPQAFGRPSARRFHLRPESTSDVQNFEFLRQQRISEPGADNPDLDVVRGAHGPMPRDIFFRGRRERSLDNAAALAVMARRSGRGFDLRPGAPLPRDVRAETERREGLDRRERLDARLQMPGVSNMELLQAEDDGVAHVVQTGDVGVRLEPPRGSAPENEAIAQQGMSAAFDSAASLARVTPAGPDPFTFGGGMDMGGGLQAEMLTQAEMQAMMPGDFGGATHQDLANIRRRRGQPAGGLRVRTTGGRLLLGRRIETRGGDFDVYEAPDVPVGGARTGLDGETEASQAIAIPTVDNELSLLDPQAVQSFDDGRGVVNQEGVSLRSTDVFGASAFGQIGRATAELTQVPSADVSTGPGINVQETDLPHSVLPDRLSAYLQHDLTGAASRMTEELRMRSIEVYGEGTNELLGAYQELSRVVSEAGTIRYAGVDRRGAREMVFGDGTRGFVLMRDAAIIIHLDQTPPAVVAEQEMVARDADANSLLALEYGFPSTQEVEARAEASQQADDSAVRPGTRAQAMQLARRRISHTRNLLLERGRSQRTLTAQDAQTQRRAGRLQQLRLTMGQGEDVRPQDIREPAPDVPAATSMVPGRTRIMAPPPQILPQRRRRSDSDEGSSSSSATKRRRTGARITTRSILPQRRRATGDPEGMPEAKRVATFEDRQRPDGQMRVLMDVDLRTGNVGVVVPGTGSNVPIIVPGMAHLSEAQRVQVAALTAMAYASVVGARSDLNRLADQPNSVVLRPSGYPLHVLPAEDYNPRALGPVSQVPRALTFGDEDAQVENPDQPSMALVPSYRPQRSTSAHHELLQRIAKTIVEQHRSDDPRR